MKGIIALFILVIGMVCFWPPGDQLKAATSDQICFVADQSPVAPVCAVMAPVQEKGGEYILGCYNQIDAKAVLMASTGDLKMDRYTMISPPKAANLERIYTKHLNKVNHPPLVRMAQKGNKVWPEYGLIRIRCMQAPNQYNEEVI
jgi:hypothetical protein